MKLGEKFINLYFDQGVFSDLLELQWQNVNTDYTRTEKMIIFVLRDKGKRNMGQLSSTLNIPNSTANFIIKKLKKNDLVKTVQNSEDKRIVEVSLTEKGQIAAEEILENIDLRLKKLFEKIEQHLQKTMTSEEMKVISKAMKLLYQ